MKEKWKKLQINQEQMKIILDLIDFWEDTRHFSDPIPDEIEVYDLKRMINEAFWSKEQELMILDEIIIKSKYTEDKLRKELKRYEKDLLIDVIIGLADLAIESVQRDEK